MGEVDAEVLFAFSLVVDVGEFGAGVDLVGFVVLVAVDGYVSVFEVLAVALGADEELEGVVGSGFAGVGGGGDAFAVGVDVWGLAGLDDFLEFFLGGFGFAGVPELELVFECPGAIFIVVIMVPVAGGGGDEIGGVVGGGGLEYCGPGVIAACGVVVDCGGVVASGALIPCDWCHHWLLSCSSRLTSSSPWQARGLQKHTRILLCSSLTWLLSPVLIRY